MTATTTTNKLNIITSKSVIDPVNLISHTCYFPESGAYTVHQSGRALSQVSRGLTVNLYQKVGKPAPHAFEFYTDDEEQYAEGGLWYEYCAEQGTRITEYDGVFCLAKEVVAMLQQLGYNTTEVE